MLYVERNAQGRICNVLQAPTETAVEGLSADHPEVLAYIHEAARLQQLLDMDREFVRAIEDLIDVLIKKEVILLTDLPLPVQDKFLRRREVRQQLTLSMPYRPGESDLIPL